LFEIEGDHILSTNDDNDRRVYEEEILQALQRATEATSVGIIASYSVVEYYDPATRPEEWAFSADTPGILKCNGKVYKIHQPHVHCAQFGVEVPHELLKLAADTFGAELLKRLRTGRVTVYQDSTRGFVSYDPDWQGYEQESY
jgi:hypothetical protein